MARIAALAIAACAGGFLAGCSGGAAVRAADSPALPARPATADDLASATPGRLLAIANSIRSRGCGGRSRVAHPLRVRSQLSAAARRLAAGAGLRQATEFAGYRATISVSVHITGDLRGEAVARILSSRFCRELTNPALRDMGFYRRGNDLWILAAAPFATPALRDPPAVAREVLDLVNEARATGRRCGRRAFGPAPPLRPSGLLREAALVHSRDMAAHSYLAHVGSNGSTPADRVTRTGYTWSAVGENVAAGPVSAREAVDGWLASPEHCANIMDPRFTQMGIAFTVDPSSRGGVYWTQEFGAPRPIRGHRRR